MQYEEEISARALYDDFMRDLAARNSEIGVSVQGQGVHWTVTVTRSIRACAVSCFQRSKYHISFKYENKTIAMGRTPSKQEVIEATNDWVHDKNIHELYKHFSFVDENKRALVAMTEGLARLSPELRQYASVKEKYLASEFDELWFSAKDRSCHIYFYCDNKFLDALFYWNDCQLFQVQTEQLSDLAFVLKRWLHDYVMPSTLEDECPWIEVGKLAHYYEQGRGTEGEFVASWDKIEEFYQRQHYPFVPEVLIFIRQIRQRGYDMVLRAGQSLWILIVSRSRRHRLRFDQANISFDFHDNGMDIEITLDSNTRKISYSKIEFTTEIDHLLKQLAAKAID